jgi:hypothetical protein
VEQTVAGLQGLQQPEELIDVWQRAWDEITDMQLDGEGEHTDTHAVGQRKRLDAWAVHWDKQCLLTLEFTRRNDKDALALHDTDALKTHLLQRADGLTGPLGCQLMLIMCYGVDSLVSCEARNGKVLEKQAPQCFTVFKACFSTQLTYKLRSTLDHCCIDDLLRRLLIMCYEADRLARCEAKNCKVRKETGSSMLHGLQGLLLHSGHQRTTLDAQSLLHRRRTPTASHQLTNSLSWTSTASHQLMVRLR